MEEEACRNRVGLEIIQRRKHELRTQEELERSAWISKLEDFVSELELWKEITSALKCGCSAFMLELHVGIALACNVGKMSTHVSEKKEV